MGPTPTRAQLRIAARVCVDAGAYAVVVAAAATALAFVVGVASGGGFVRMKTLLFLSGFGLMAYSTARLWPTSTEDVGADGVGGVAPPAGGSVPTPTRQTRFESVARQLPPARWSRLPPADRRLTPAGKLFWGSVTVLLVSYAMEAVFGVAAV